MRRIQSLDGRWELRIGTEEASVAANIPGSVCSALLEEGRLEDPYWRDNEKNVMPVMENDFLFTCRFRVEESVRDFPEKLLRFEGIDTIGEIFLNGALLGTVENMHRSYEFVVTDLLKEGENELEVRIFSPTRFIREAYEKCPVDGAKDSMEGFPHIRKAHCMFGWDWGPRIPDAGIFRSVSLIGFAHGLIDSVQILQFHGDGKVRLELQGEGKYVSGDAKPEFLFTVTGPDGEIYCTEEHASETCDAPVGEDGAAHGAKNKKTVQDFMKHSDNMQERDARRLAETVHASAEYSNAEMKEILIEDPRLWWPRGYGGQPLYTVRAEMLVNGEIQDVWEKRIGLRILTMAREKDAWGESFATQVNGVWIFAMGADYIPEDCIYSRINEERTRRLLEDCALANFNSVRVWGGGYYPDDYFFDICDELGLLVWHDLMFACAVYELTEEFEENITEEVIDNVKRLRNHPSIALWCGNNEMEWQVGDGTKVSTPKQKSDYIKMYEYIFPKIMKTYDPQRFYWSSSPSSGGGFDQPNDPDRGDVHYWEVWHGDKNFSDYRNYYFRYASEFGFQSFPCMKTVRSFTEPEDRNIFSYIMEKHQRNKSANGRILLYLSQMYLYPGKFDTLLYASQILQAEAMKYGVEHWRRNRGRCMGAIYWQLNDCWPVASWSSIDYAGRWKALHYYARRFFAPLLLSCCEEGTLTQNTNVNAQNTEIEKSARLSVANETMEDAEVTVRWALRDPSGTELRSGQRGVAVPALTSVWLEKLDFSDEDEHERYFSYEMYKEDKVLSQGTVLFCQPKHFKFRDPHLRAEVNGDCITVYADSYAKSVEIDCEDGDMVLSDNYFDMNGGFVKVKILRGQAGTLKLRSVYDIR